ncbi:FtsK/SpoIIIE domain-containing protein [Neobacillus cucumis]|uniref:Cell division protein FtsK n=1 Tax=Neobacillus cucumis TaxID=1740721 RepID=A0A2N5HEP9_9BACI|nr:FtsK/SpoIIIE domain-containing protein [Neobacillus cucumis]PLS04011.1 cell division protein FtsK [Neobacillus cucumis]
MIFEVVTTTIFGAISLKAYQAKLGVGNDSKKINKVFALSGLNVKDGNQTLTTQLIRKKNHDWGIEYRYRIPLGRSFHNYLNKKEEIQAAVNVRSIKIQFKDIRKYFKDLKFDKELISNIKDIQTKKLTGNKEIEMEYDGVLKIKVYNTAMTNDFKYTIDLLEKCNGWEVPIGITRTELIKHDFDKVYNMIIAGSPGYGKSVLLKNIITSLVIRKQKDVKLTLIDLKGGLAFNRFKNLDQVDTVAKTPSEALTALKSVRDKLVKMIDYLLENGYEDVKEAGIKERFFCIIDEAADLSFESEALEIVKDIARRGRGAGFRLIYATQYPTNETLPSQVRQNCDSRVCFMLQTNTASRAVLDDSGAENLPLILGRAIYQTDRNVIVQTPLIENKDIDEWIKPFIIEKKEGVNIETSKQKAGADTFVIKTTRLS